MFSFFDVMDADSFVLHASEAKKLSERKEERNDLNYRLTFGRLMKIIEMSAKNGNAFVEFQAPHFVLDGSLADPILLARQLSKRLKQLGYQVKREGANLVIQWSE